MTNRLSRRSFLTTSALGAAAVSLGGAFADEPQKPNIQGFDETDTDVDPNAEWNPHLHKNSLCRSISGS
ncbi:MAG: twin-arginine translocation signal domain-containing protein, partial [Thermoguttaceae bacterium]|nr:twin-arginine translocation signal domain-containing protein [Thermoguttaceae bacterium]